MLQQFALDAALCREETSWKYNRSFSVWFHRIQHMLKEACVDGHTLFFLLRHIWDTCPKTGWHSRKRFSCLREIQVEWRVSDLIIKLPERFSIIAHMERVSQSISLDCMVKRGNQTIKNQVQLEHLITLLGTILRKNRAAIFTNLMSKYH